MKLLLTALAGLVLSACAATPPVATAPRTIDVQILAINDFHGSLEPPPPIETPSATIKSGGAAQLAGLLASLRTGHPNSITVAAGDLVGASPVTSALFLDEPTIKALGNMQLSVASVGNHEFDKGVPELKRLRGGGCEKYTLRTPCALEPFRGSAFEYLAANVIGSDGKPVFPATALRRVGPVTIGFIGLTLQKTAVLVPPSAVAGVTFTDEAATANALVPGLKAQGADAIVLLIHQGGRTPDFADISGCNAISGDILPILDRLDPAIQTVISGHTHWPYVCHRGGRLLTSAGKLGMMATDLELTFDASSHRLIAQDAANRLATGVSDDPAMASYVEQVAAAAAPMADRVVGSLTAPAPNDQTDWESPAADLIADAYLAATRAPENGGAQIAVVNATGVRVSFPAGPMTYKSAFAVMPFGNTLITKSFTGAQLKAIIEQQYALAQRYDGAKPTALAVSQGFTYAVDLSKPTGARVSDLRLDGKPIDPAATYRVVTNNYLASGGDGLSLLSEGTNPTEGGIDLDALIAWVANGRSPPVADRIRLVTPR